MDRATYNYQMLHYCREDNIQDLIVLSVLFTKHVCIQCFRIFVIHFSSSDILSSKHFVKHQRSILNRHFEQNAFTDIPPASRTMHFRRGSNTCRTTLFYALHKLKPPLVHKPLTFWRLLFLPFEYEKKQVQM